MSKSKSAIGTEAPPTGNGGLKAQSSAQRDFSDVTLAPKKPGAMPVPSIGHPLSKIPTSGPPPGPGPGDPDFDLEYQDWRRLGSSHEEATTEARRAVEVARATRPFPDLPPPVPPGQAPSAEHPPSEQPGSTEQPYRNPDAYQGDTWQLDPKLDWTPEARRASIALGPAPALRDARWNRVRAEALEGLTTPNMTDDDDMRAWAAALREADDDASERIRAFDWDTFHNRPAKQSTIPGAGLPAFEPEPEPEPEPERFNAMPDTPKRKRGRPPGAKTKKPPTQRAIPDAQLAEKAALAEARAEEWAAAGRAGTQIKEGLEMDAEPSYFTANHDVSEDDAPASRPDPVGDNPVAAGLPREPERPAPGRDERASEIGMHRAAAETIGTLLSRFNPAHRTALLDLAQVVALHADALEALERAL